MNRGEIRTLTANLVEDPNQTRFTATVYNDSIDKAQKQFAMDSKALYKDQAITMVVGTGGYSLPTDFMLEKSVTLNGIELDPISRATLEAKKRNDKWSDDKGTPRWYIIDPEEARKTITLYPIPDSDTDGTAIVLTYYPVPATMTADGDVPLNSSSLMTQFHTAIASYAAWIVLTFLAPTEEIQAKKSALFKIYSDKIAEAIQTFGNTKSEPLGFHPDSMRVR